MGEREDFEALMQVLGNPGAVVRLQSEMETPESWMARAILASDWLRARDQRVREECAKVAESVPFPDGYFWSDSNKVKFSFGAVTAAKAIRGDAK